MAVVGLECSSCMCRRVSTHFPRFAAAGPVWKPPRPRAVLRGLPFMSSLPDALFKAILAAGIIKGECGARQWLTGVLLDNGATAL